MTSAVKRSYPFGSRPTSLVEDSNQFQVVQIPSSHKKKSVTSPNISAPVENYNCSSSSPSSRKHTKTIETPTMTKNDVNSNGIVNSSGIVNGNGCINITSSNGGSSNGGDKSPLPSPPSAKGRKNMKNLQLVVPPVRSSISAPNSPQLPPNNSTYSAYSHNRRPSTPLCFYQNKDVANSNAADPMALMSKTENAIGEELPYKEEPIRILDNLYLGSELNAANRPMLNRLNIEFILNVGKEVENPYLDEIVNFNTSDTNTSNTTTGYFDYQHFSSSMLPNPSTPSSNSFKSDIQTHLPQFHHEPTSFVPSTIDLLRSNSSKKMSTISQRSPSPSSPSSSPSPSSSSSSPSSSPSALLQSTRSAMLSGIPLTVPATSKHKQIKYKKFFWTHNQENLISDFTSAFAFINEARSAGKSILVHCQCGVSRSASLIIGYVMEANSMNLNQAYEFVKNRSPYISPNMSLVYQLVDFEKTLKLNNNNNNDSNNNSNRSSINGSLPSTPTKSQAESVKSHSRQSSIESDLLLKSHRRSSSIPRTQINNNSSHTTHNTNNSHLTSSFNITAAATHNIMNNISININDYPPKTPLIPPSEGLLSIQPHQATVKGNGSGRFHVITASTAPTTPTALSPASSLSPTSSTSPTTPSSELSSPITNSSNNSKSNRSSRPSPLPSSTNSYMSSNYSPSSSLTSSPSPSSMDRNQLTPHEAFSPTFPLNRSPSFTDLSSTISNNNNNSNLTTTTTTTTTSNTNGPFTNYDNLNISQSNVSLFSSHSKTSPRMINNNNNSIDKNNTRQQHHVNNQDHEVLSGPSSRIFSKPILDSIFSPTRTSPPITPVTITNLHDLLGDDVNKDIYTIQ